LAPGHPIGASSGLLAHDFALQSLVCYTFCDRGRRKGAARILQTLSGARRTEVFEMPSEFQKCSVRVEAMLRNFIRRGNAAAAPGAQRVYKARHSDAPFVLNTTTAAPATRCPAQAPPWISPDSEKDENASLSPSADAPYRHQSRIGNAGMFPLCPQSR